LACLGLREAIGVFFILSWNWILIKLVISNYMMMRKFLLVHNLSISIKCWYLTWWTIIFLPKYFDAISLSLVRNQIQL
jgi:hypothetical protein